MPHRIVHEYDRLNLTTIWQTVQDALPELIRVLETLIPPEDDPS